MVDTNLNYKREREREKFDSALVRVRVIKVQNIVK